MSNFVFKLLGGDTILGTNLVKDFIVDLDFMFSNDYPCFVFLFNEVKPWMPSNVRDVVTLIWVNDKYLFYQILQVVTKRVRYRVFRRLDLLVQLARVFVLKRQGSRHHGEQNDTTTPYVGHQAMVFLPLHHLRGGIARTSTSGFKHLTLFVEVAQTKIH